MSCGWWWGGWVLVVCGREGGGGGGGFKAVCECVHDQITVCVYLTLLSLSCVSGCTHGPWRLCSLHRPSGLHQNVTEICGKLEIEGRLYRLSYSHHNVITAVITLTHHSCLPVCLRRQRVGCCL